MRELLLQQIIFCADSVSVNAVTVLRRVGHRPKTAAAAAAAIKGTPLKESFMLHQEYKDDSYLSMEGGDTLLAETDSDLCTSSGTTRGVREELPPKAMQSPFGSSARFRSHEINVGPNIKDLTSFCRRPRSDTC